MKLVKALALLVAILALSTGAARIALADSAPVIQPAQFFGHLYYDLGTGAMYVPKGGAQTELVGDVYNNTNPNPGANLGAGATDLAAQWGDRLATIGTGVLQVNDFTMFNGQGGPLLTARVAVQLFDGTSLASLGGYSVNINFGGGLLAGSYVIVTVSGIGGVNINVNTTDVIIIQQITAYTGTPTSLGVASLDPPSIGSSPSTMYINASTVGPAGFYVVGNPPVNGNPGYRLNLNQPVPADSKSWGAVKALYR